MTDTDSSVKFISKPSGGTLFLPDSNWEVTVRWKSKSEAGTNSDITNRGKGMDEIASERLQRREGKEDDLMVIKILFLAANPSDTTRLRLDEEIRDIAQALRQTGIGDKFDIKQEWAVRVKDLQDHLLRHKPHIIHFSGHGSEIGEILLEDETGNRRPISVRALSNLFSILKKDNIQGVVLNACYSEQQAQAIVEHTKWVIGVSKAIGDKAAIGFATAFYRALGYDKDIKTAFELGCNQILVEGLNGQDRPKLFLAEKFDERSQSFRGRKQKSRPEHGSFPKIDFDVFLCYNSQDRPMVETIGKRLKKCRLMPWLDEWEFRPGLPWQKALEEQIENINAAAVFIGPNGIGPWQDMEVDALLRQFVQRGCPVIPVILPDCEGVPKLPVFLKGMMWVDFRKEDPDPLKQLIWGITGKCPQRNRS